ncbi:hypothetical protein BDZ91DRAFT_835834 [Kalaharituber pfeilii]|nr:hypothetical protein BDZ91DRAFT_835834 [Kalaharituber pfeilii]
MRPLWDNFGTAYTQAIPCHTNPTLQAEEVKQIQKRNGAKTSMVIAVIQLIPTAGISSLAVPYIIYRHHDAKRRLTAVREELSRRGIPFHEKNWKDYVSPALKEIAISCTIGEVVGGAFEIAQNLNVELQTCFDTVFPVLAETELQGDTCGISDNIINYPGQPSQDIPNVSSEAGTIAATDTSYAAEATGGEPSTEELECAKDTAEVIVENLISFLSGLREDCCKCGNYDKCFECMSILDISSPRCAEKHPLQRLQVAVNGETFAGEDTSHLNNQSTFNCDRCGKNGCQGRYFHTPPPLLIDGADFWMYLCSRILKACFQDSGANFVG